MYWLLTQPFTVYNKAKIAITDVGPGNYVGSFGYGKIQAKQNAVGDGVVFRNSRIRMAEVTDGTSTTLFVGERASNLARATWTGAVSNGVVPALAPGLSAGDAPVLVLGHTSDAGGIYPSNSLKSVAGFSSFHPGGVLFAFGDGSVRFVAPGVAPATWKALGSRAGGEATSLD